LAIQSERPEGSMVVVVEEELIWLVEARREEPEQLAS
jgi:hypothetical protein